jgi:hypothetical protein
MNQGASIEAEKPVRTMLIVGAGLSCAGIAWTAIDASTWSNASVLVGLFALIWGTHRLGRLGPAPAAKLPEVRAGDGPSPTKST